MAEMGEMGTGITATATAIYAKSRETVISKATGGRFRQWLFLAITRPASCTRYWLQQKRLPLAGELC